MKKLEIDATIGLRVRKWRLIRGMSQAQLAKDDFSKGFISLIETGRTRMSVRSALILAKRLGLDASRLIDPESKPVAPEHLLCPHCKGSGLKRGRKGLH